VKRYIALIVFLLIGTACYATYLNTKPITGGFMMVQKSTWHSYGGFQQSTAEITCTQNVWAKITNATNNLWVMPEIVGMTMANDTITITNPGDYAGNLTVAISGANGNDFFIRAVNKTTGVQQGYVIGGTTSTAGNYTNLALPLYFENVTAGATFEMEIMNINASNNPIVRSAVFYLTYLHD